MFDDPRLPSGPVCSKRDTRHYQLEIAYSHFERSIELPNLDPARVATEYRDGMLVVRIQTEAKP